MKNRSFLIVVAVVKEIRVTKELFSLCDVRLSARINSQMLVDEV